MTYRIENYLKEILSDPDLPQTTEQWQQRLSGLGFLAETASDKLVCTIAGLVLFGFASRRYLRQTGIRIMVFAGEDKSYQAVVDEVVVGPLVGRWGRDEAGNKHLVDDGLIEKIASLLRPFVSQEVNTIDAQMRRPKIWLYPWDAVRETIINAFAHRDWTRSVDIEVTCYSDRIVVISPGALQNSMTIEKMKAGQRSPRNPLLVEVLRDYGYVDARGMGVRTKIIPLMKQHNNTEPVFCVTDDYVKTILLQRDRGATSKSVVSAVKF